MLRVRLKLSSTPPSWVPRCWLDKGWRVGITADPAAATPEFTDSGWALRDAQAPLPRCPMWINPPEQLRVRPGKTHEPYTWFPGSILKLAPHQRPLALLASFELAYIQNTDHELAGL